MNKFDFSTCIWLFCLHSSGIDLCGGDEESQGQVEPVGQPAQTLPNIHKNDFTWDFSISNAIIETKPIFYKTIIS
jgi:hypothetical protein